MTAPTPATALAAQAAAWMLTYLLHSTVLLGAAWLVARRLGGRRVAVQEALWRAALLGGLVTASLQVGLGWRPLGAGWTIDELAGTAGGAVSPTIAGEALSPLPESAVPAVGSLSAAPETIVPTGNGGSATAPAPSGPAWPLVALAAWLAGALALGLGLAASYARLAHRLRGRRPVREGAIAALFGRLLDRAAAAGRGARAGRPPRVALTASPRVPVPIAWGVARPEVSLPERVVRDLSPYHQESILAHELAHLLRRDPAWLAVARACEALLFFQPMNRVARARLQRLSEYRCDDRAVELTGRPVELARCLTEVASWRLAAAAALPVPTMEAGPGLGDRVLRLLAPGARSERTPRWLPAAAAAALLALAAFTPGVSGGDVPPAPPAAPEAPAPAPPPPAAVAAPAARPAAPSGLETPAAAPRPPGPGHPVETPAPGAPHPDHPSAVPHPAPPAHPGHPHELPGPPAEAPQGPHPHDLPGAGSEAIHGPHPHELPGSAPRAPHPPRSPGAHARPRAMPGGHPHELPGMAPRAGSGPHPHELPGAAPEVLPTPRPHPVPAPEAPAVPQAALRRGIRPAPAPAPRPGSRAEPTPLPDRAVAPAPEPPPAAESAWGPLPRRSPPHVAALATPSPPAALATGPATRVALARSPQTGDLASTRDEARRRAARLEAERRARAIRQDVSRTREAGRDRVERQARQLREELARAREEAQAAGRLAPRPPDVPREALRAAHETVRAAIARDRERLRHDARREGRQSLRARCEAHEARCAALEEACAARWAARDEARAAEDGKAVGDR